MATAKDIRVTPISSKDARECVKRHHYSGSVVNNSQLHLGVFLNGRLEGVMQFCPSMDKGKLQPLVTETTWNGFIELNRMAFSPALPKNSESRAIGIALRLIRKTYPHIEWVVSFADATQCGDGTIYRASGFVLTGLRPNTQLWKLPNGKIVTKMTYTKGKHAIQNGGGAGKPEGVVTLPGFQLRYVYFINPDARKRLTVAEIPFSKINELGAGMYLGQKRAGSKANVVSTDQVEEGGATPTPALQNLEVTEAVHGTS